MNDAEKLTRIGEAAAQAFGTTYADIAAGSKHLEPMQARVTAMWVASKLLPHYPKRHIAKALGRAQGEAVGDAVRRVMSLRARNCQYREKVDGLYKALEAELGVSQEQKTPQKYDSPIGATQDYSWGFSGLNTGTRYYFERQNERFAEAMAKAGIRQHVVGPE